MKKTSIAFRLNFIMTLITLVIASFSIVLITVGYQVQTSSKKVTQEDMPLALNSLAMLEELGDMNSNLLEYLLGEQEEKLEYFGNYNEFFRFRDLIPKDSVEEVRLKELDGMIQAHRAESERRVFNTYDPTKEQRAAAMISLLIEQTGRPLEALLDEMKEEEILDVGSANSLDDVINDDLPGVRYYLELVDEAGDMLADLDRFVLGDVNARQSFFENALVFETFLARLKPLEQKPIEKVKIKEIERLFNELKETGGRVFEEYLAFDRVSALKAVDELEHEVFNNAELVLDKMSADARDEVQNSMSSLQNLATYVEAAMLVTTVVGVTLVVFILVYVRKSVFEPIRIIADTVTKLRSGDRDFDIEVPERKDELSDVVLNLKQFQRELSELDSLRKQEEVMLKNLANERDRAQAALKELESTQDKLGAMEQLKIAQEKLAAAEKLASLGSLVAGVAHEVNTPIGVGVTMSTTLQSQCNDFIGKIKSGEIKKSHLDKFESESEKSFKLLIGALAQASHLISNFKQVAVDQTSSSKREFNVHQVFDEVLSTLHHQIKNTDIEVRLTGNEDIVVDSYPGPLGQVITNLYNNAIIHGFDGRNHGMLHLHYEKNGDELIIEFSDDGNGIDEDKLSKVFDPFFTTKLGQGGSGLGLNIVHNIVNGLLGGSIEVLVGGGKTVFKVCIPMNSPDRDESDE